MPQPPTIETVMTPLVHAIEIDATVSDAEQRMFDLQIRHLAVMEDGSLVGVLSDSDIAFTPNAAEYSLRTKLTVREVCSLDVFTAEHDDPLDRVLTEMAERRVGATLVTRGEEMVGIFTTTDACLRFAELLRSG